MRVVKPNSTSNSPLEALGSGRRRTFIAESQRRAAPVMDHNSMAQPAWQSNDGLQIPARTSRPMSWHPAPLPLQHTRYSPGPVQAAYYNNEHVFDHSPAPSAVYSGFTSPASSFSPLALPQAQYQQQYPVYNPLACQPPSMPYIAYQSPQYQDPQYAVPPKPSHFIDNTNSAMYSHSDWNNFVANGFEQPPTPSNVPSSQQPEPIFTPEEAIPYHPLSEAEPDGEELVALGLYDTPSKQSGGFMALGGFRPSEPTGKGLKLEEAWEPSASDDSSSDDDGDGDEENEEERAAYEQRNAVPKTTADGHDFALNGWL